MQQHHIRPHQPGEYVNLQPGRHLSPPHTTASFAQAIERLGHQHENKTNDANPMTKQLAGRGDFARKYHDQTIQPSDQDHRDECQPELSIATKHIPSESDFSERFQLFVLPVQNSANTSPTLAFGASNFSRMGEISAWFEISFSSGSDNF